MGEIFEIERDVEGALADYGSRRDGGDLAVEAAARLKSAKGSAVGEREGAARAGVGGETERANAAGFIGRMPSGSGLAGRYRSSANIGLVCIGGGDGDVVDGK